MKYSENNITLKRLDSRNDYLSGMKGTDFSEPYANLFYPYLTDNGGVSSDVSLTIDYIEKPKEIKTSNVLPNEKWFTPPERTLKSLIGKDFPWGFKETSLQSGFLCNAFCFSNQNIRVYIAPQGHLGGYVDGRWIYTKTKLSITLTDIVNGTQTVIKQFDLFESAYDNPNRYFDFVIPSGNNTFLGKYGCFGVVVLTMELSFDFYEDAEFKKKNTLSLNATKTSHLQILTFSPSIEASSVTDPMGIFTEAINGDETMEELFDKSIFANYDGINCPLLSQEQKKAVIADQMAVLFMSQHPVITSDYYPMKLLGYGAAETVKPKYILNKAITYSQRHPDVVPMINDRLYGMLLRYKTFGLSNEIDKYFANFSQSVQVVRDPARTIAVKEDGRVDFDFGDDGILFNPFAIETVGAEMPNDINLSNEFNISQNNKTVSISAITITNENGTQITTSTQAIKVAFSVLENEDIISSIKYSIWTNNNLGWEEYVTESVETSHVFNMRSENKISINGTNPVTLGDIVKTRVDITDINGIVNSFYQDVFLPYNSERPSLMNIVGVQTADGSGFIDIYYTYVGASEINGTTVKLYYSYDNTQWVLAEQGVTGDIGAYVMPGHKRIRWFPWNEINEETERIFVKLTLLDVDNKTSISKTDGAAIQVSHKPPSIAIRRLNKNEILDMYESSSSSSSSSSSTSMSSSSSSSSLMYSTSSSSKSSSSTSSSSKSSNSSSSSSSNSSSSSSTWVRTSSSSKSSESSSTSSIGYSESSESSSIGYSESSESSSIGYSVSSTSSSIDAIGVTITDISGDMVLWRNTKDVVTVRESDCVSVAGHSMLIDRNTILGDRTYNGGAYPYQGWSTSTNQLVVTGLINAPWTGNYNFALEILVDRGGSGGGARNIRIESVKSIASYTFVSTNPSGMTHTPTFSNSDKRLDISYSGDHYPQILTVYFN